MSTRDGQRAMRARLLELHGAVKAYFETTVAVGSAGGQMAAFEALRRNPHLSESFVTELMALLTFLETELAPALTRSGSTAEPAPQSEPASRRGKRRE